MAMKVINTAQLMCTFGAAPSVLMVTPKNLTMTTDQPQANIMDNIPMMNIMPFGMCMSLANPAVASATAAALGVLTPMPCIPATAAPVGARDRRPCWSPTCRRCRTHRNACATGAA